MVSTMKSTVTHAVEREFDTGRVSTLAVAHNVHDTYTAFLAPLLPEFIETMALTTTQAGLLTVFLRVPSLLQPLIGYLADHVNLRYIVILAPAVTATMMSLLGIAPSYLILALFLVIAGISSAAMHAVGPVMVGRLSGKKLGRGMGFWMVGGELGRVTGPLVVTAALSWLSLQGLPWLALGGALASFLLFLLLRDVAAAPPDLEAALPWREAIRRMGPFLLFLAALIFGRAFMAESLATYLSTFLQQEGAERWFANVSLSVFEAAGVVGALLGGSLSDRLGRRRVLVTSLILSPALMLVFLALSGGVRVPVLLLLGFSTLSTTPVIMALVQERFPENRSLANGIYMALSFVGRSLVALVLGFLGDAFGLRMAFTLGAVVPLLVLPVVLWLPGGLNTKN